MTADILKFIALIAMTSDHIALAFISPEDPIYFVMRFFGRATAPIMTFFIVEGYIHTRNRKKYFMRILIFAMISQPFYFLLSFQREPASIFEFLTNLNILFNFCTSFITLKILSQKMNMTVKVFLIGGCIIISDICDR